MANLQEIAALGTTPIPGEHPTGISARYEAEYEAIQSEIEKLQSVSQVPVRWDNVVSLGSTLLSTKTKDLLIASYVTSGLIVENGYTGLSSGLAFYKEFLSTFWDKLYPPVEKMRGREGAVRWLDERAAKLVSDAPSPSESDRAPIESCLAALEAVNGTLSEKFTESPLRLTELGEKLQEKLASVPEPPPPEAPPAEAAASESGASTATGEAAAAEPAPPPPPAEIDSVDAAREAVGKAITFLRTANPADPLPFELERVLAWGAVVEVPEPIPSGADPALLPGWETALKKKDYQRVLDEAQAKCREAPFWLDPHLYAVRAMEGLGAAYDAARAAVAAQVAALVRRLRDLPAATLDGGAPAASEVTQQWIGHELLGGSAAPAEGAAPDRLDGVMQEARKLATRGKLPAATALLQKELLTVPPGRARFLWRLNLARLCAESGRPHLAVPQLEALDAEAERGGLEQWEPELAVEVVKILWQCYSSLSKTGGEAMSEKAARSYARLCRLDLSTAMALDGKK